MSQSYDAIVLGLGAMGSAAAYHLARRGQRVLGIEQFGVAHDRGSSHGRSRIIRQAYLEGSDYVPLVLRAYELWRELERETGRELLRVTGGLMLGEPDSEAVAGSIASARTYGLPYEVLTAAELRRRYPLAPAAADVGVLDPAAGALFPEDCVRAHLDRAASLGAELRFHTPVSGWKMEGGGVDLTADGATYCADRLVVTAGAWAGNLLADLGLPLSPERNVLYWFRPRTHAKAFASESFPVFIWDHPDRVFYGLPDLRGEGVKVGFHHSGDTADPDALRRDVSAAEVAAIRARLAASIPALDVEPVDTAVCMYTNTPDEHFAVGVHPHQPQVCIAAGFSGHGFKFASVMGEVLADLATTGATRHPIAQLRLERFGA